MEPDQRRLVPEPGESHALPLAPLLESLRVAQFVAYNSQVTSYNLRHFWKACASASMALSISLHEVSAQSSREVSGSTVMSEVMMKSAY